MAADRRDAIVDAVMARMETIKTANGYNTDAGGRVTRWRATEPSESACPTIDVRDPARELSGSFTQAIRDYSLTVECIGSVAGGADADGNLNLLLDDILTAMLDGDATFGGLVIDTVFEADEKLVSQQNVKTGVAISRFKIRYRKN